MNNKKMILIFTLVILVVAAAAFVGGRLLNGSVAGTGPGGLIALGDGQAMASVSIQMSAAPELPTTKPEVTGTFSSRQDNSIFLQSFAMMEGVSGAAGVVISSSDSGGESGGPSFSGGSGAPAGPTTEVVITSDTILYRDATEFTPPSSGEATIQQKVEPGDLDDLKSQTMVMVWGRKSGDRIIADVVSYSNPIMIQKP